MTCVCNEIRRAFVLLVKQQRNIRTIYLKATNYTNVDEAMLRVSHPFSNFMVAVFLKLHMTKKVEIGAIVTTERTICRMVSVSNDPNDQLAQVSVSRSTANISQNGAF